MFGAPFFRPEALVYNFYPELQDLDDYIYDGNRTNVLILAGSVLAPDTVHLEISGSVEAAHFCDPALYLQEERFQVVNLARPAHNTLDSRYKYGFIEQKFDAVFIYHGINDSRANNIAVDDFDNRYRHIEFYDDLYVVFRHPEINLTALPFTVHWLVHSVRKRHRQYIPREMFQGLLSEKPEDFVLAGDHVSSSVTFRSNIEDIVERSRRKGETVILSTYAWYLPDGYTLERFKSRSLDYSQQIFPAELYGIPERVAAAVRSHNEAVRSISGSMAVPLLSVAEHIPLQGAYFDDICHITGAGCEILSGELETALVHLFPENNDPKSGK